MYTSYWNRILEQWAERRLDEPDPSETKRLAEHVKSHVVARRNARGGRSAAEHLIAALRCVYNHAVADGHLTDNPARKVAKPRRLPSTRRAARTPAWRYCPGLLSWKASYIVRAAVHQLFRDGSTLLCQTIGLLCGALFQYSWSSGMDALGAACRISE